MGPAFGSGQGWCCSRCAASRRFLRTIQGLVPCVPIKGGPAVQRMSLGGVLGRFLASLALVVATYNPTGYSLVGWIGSGFPHVQPLQAVIGIVLLGFWLFFVHATWISLGTIGV